MLSAESESRVRVAISGIGMVTPCGADRESSWHGLLSGQSAVRWLTPAEHAARHCDIDRTRLAGAPAILPTDADPQFAFSMDVMARSAAAEALADADLNATDLNPQRTGVVVGTSKGSLGAWQQLLSGPHDPEFQRALWNAGWSNSPALCLAADYRLHGPAVVPVAACATGLLSICRGVQLIQDGQCDVVLAGSVDDSLSEILWASYRRLGVLARVKDVDPGEACRPFDRDRHGFLMGGGAGIVILERWEQATSRGHQPYGEWLAGAMASDSLGLTQVSPDAAGLTHLITDVLRRGDTRPDELD
ncbi:MAG: beta-ketoacyl synthase N-terminal-like domain-containing protein [Planctomycetota bacterium]